MGHVPMRAIVSIATLVGVVTMGAVVILGAPPTHADRVRQVSERAARARDIARQIRDAMDEGRLSDAVRLTDQHIDEYPADASAWLYYSLVRQRLGDQTSASMGWDRLFELATRDPQNRSANPGQMILEGMALYGRGDKEAARRVWGLATEVSRQRPGGGQNFYHLARLLAFDGQHADALGALHMALDVGFRHRMMVEADPAMDPLRREARYHSAIDRLKRTRMGPPPRHGVSPNQGETGQILSLDSPFEERLQSWIERMGDL